MPPKPPNQGDVAGPAGSLGLGQSAPTSGGSRIGIPFVFALFAALLWATIAFVLWRDHQIGFTAFLVQAGLATALIAGALAASPRRAETGGLDQIPGPDDLEGWSREELEAALAALNDLRRRGRIHGPAYIRAEGTIQARLDALTRQNSGPEGEVVKEDARRSNR